MAFAHWSVSSKKYPVFSFVLLLFFGILNAFSPPSRVHTARAPRFPPSFFSTESTRHYLRERKPPYFPGHIGLENWTIRPLQRLGHLFPLSHRPLAPLTLRRRFLRPQSKPLFLARPSILTPFRQPFPRPVNRPHEYFRLERHSFPIRPWRHVTPDAAPLPRSQRPPAVPPPAASPPLSEGARRPLCHPS